MLNIKKICLNVAVALILPSAMFAQRRQRDQPAAKPSKHMESHIGNLTGTLRGRSTAVLPLLLGLPRSAR